MWVYIWIPYSVSLIYASIYCKIPYNLDYCSYTISFEIRQTESSHLKKYLRYSSCFTFPYKFQNNLALTRVGQWLEHRPQHRRVTGSIPKQWHVPGCSFALHPGQVSVGGNQLMYLSHFNVSLSFSLPSLLSPLSKNSITMSSGED